MDTFPQFGPAVDAAMPFLHTGGNSLALSPSDFEGTLYRHMRFTMTGFNPPILARVRACWDYLTELTRVYADTCCVEPTFANGKRPDLLLTHRHAAYVIEVKTRPHDVSFEEKDDPRGKHADYRRKLAAQVVDTACLAYATGRHRVVYGYVLYFSNSRRRPLEIEWKPLCRLG